MHPEHAHGPLGLLIITLALNACAPDEGASGTLDALVADAAPEPELDAAPEPELDAETDGAPDGGPAPAEPCAAFCAPEPLATINLCLVDEGDAVDRASCLEACADQNLAGAADCVAAAGDDCDAAAACFAGDEPPVEFTIDGTDAVMTGVIDGRTPGTVRQLIEAHPEITRIVLRDVPGSLDDVANLRAARLVRAAGLATHVPADGVIASGGVDFFCAGRTRTAEVAAGARLGVHTWGGPGFDGASLPRDHPEHARYLDFYAEMGIPADFYWFTLAAAPVETVHWMTADEVETYGLTTE